MEDYKNNKMQDFPTLVSILRRKINFLFFEVYNLFTLHKNTLNQFH